MYSNYNELNLGTTLTDYNPGDTFHYDGHYNRFKIFDGLQIKRIHYCFGVVLVFDWNEWNHNKKQYGTKSDKHKQ